MIMERFQTGSVLIYHAFTFRLNQRKTREILGGTETHTKRVAPLQGSAEPLDNIIALFPKALTQLEIIQHYWATTYDTNHVRPHIFWNDHGPWLNSTAVLRGTVSCILQVARAQHGFSKETIHVCNFCSQRGAVRDSPAGSPRRQAVKDPCVHTGVYAHSAYTHTRTRPHHMCA